MKICVSENEKLVLASVDADVYLFRVEVNEAQNVQSKWWFSTQSTLPPHVLTLRGCISSQMNGFSQPEAPKLAAMQWHPCITTSGIQRSFVFGLDNGDIIRHNCGDTSESILGASILKPGPDRKFVRKEFFRYHRHPIVNITFMSEHEFASLDVEGYVLIWTYELNHFGSNGHFIPSLGARYHIDLNQYIFEYSEKTTRVFPTEGDDTSPEAYLLTSDLDFSRKPWRVKQLESGEEIRNFLPADDVPWRGPSNIMLRVDSVLFDSTGRVARHSETEVCRIRKRRFIANAESCSNKKDMVVLISSGNQGEFRLLNIEDDGGIQFSNFFLGPIKKIDRVMFKVGIFQQDLGSDYLYVLHSNQIFIYSLETSELACKLDVLDATMLDINHGRQIFTYAPPTKGFITIFNTKDNNDYTKVELMQTRRRLKNDRLPDFSTMFPEKRVYFDAKRAMIVKIYPSRNLATIRVDDEEKLVHVSDLRPWLVQEVHIEEMLELMLEEVVMQQN